MRKTIYSVKRCLAGVMAAMMLVSMMPETAYAASVDGMIETGQAFDSENQTEESENLMVEDTLDTSLDSDIRDNTEQNDDVETADSNAELKDEETDAADTTDGVDNEDTADATDIVAIDEDIRNEEELIEEAVDADEVDELGGIKSGKCGDNLTYKIDSNKTLTISGSGDMYDYEQSGAPWFGQIYDKVSLSDNITYIGAYAFEQTNAKISKLPSALTGIGNSAFEYARKPLTVYSYPSGLEYIGDFAFRSAYDIDGEGITLTMPDSLTYIGNGAFYENRLIKSVTFGENSKLKTIGNLAFHQNPFKTKLEEFQFPERLEQIGYNAFEKTKLKSVTIPANVNSIGANAFLDCKELESVVIAEGTKLKAIPNSMFENCVKLSSVTINEGVETIGYEAFRNNTALTEITLPASISFIASSAFDDTVNITYLAGTAPSATGVLTGKCGDNITWTLKKISESEKKYELILSGYGRMYDYSGVENETAPGVTPGFARMYTSTPWMEALRGEKTAAFYLEDSVVDKATISEGITYIGKYAFAGMKLIDVTIPSTVTEIGDYAFAEGLGYSISSQAVNLVIPNSVKKIDRYAFFNCDISSLTIGNSVETIGDMAFCAGTEMLGGKRCSMGAVIFPASLKEIGNCAFKYDKGLTGISFEEGSLLKSIGKDAFSYTGIDKAILPEGLSRISYTAFAECENLTEASIPGTVAQIPALFDGSSNLSKVELHEGTESIGESAFVIEADGTLVDIKLREVDIPDSVSRIDTCAFAYGMTVTSSGGWKDSFWDKSVKLEWGASETDKVGYAWPTMTYFYRSTTSAAAPVLESIALSTNEIILEPGQTQIIKVTTTPAKLTGKVVTWTNSNESIVTVEKISDSEALVSAKPAAGGYATINVEVMVGNVKKTASAKVVVAPKLTGLSTGVSSLAMYLGDTVYFNVNVEPAACRTMCDFDVEVSTEGALDTDSDALAVVDYIDKSGRIAVTALRSGISTVTISEKNSGLNAKVNVTVLDNTITLAYLGSDGVTAKTRVIPAIHGAALDELSDPAYVPGKIFKGWNTTAAGTGTWVNKNTVFNNSLRNVMESPWKLYAIYEEAPADGYFSICTTGEYTYTGKPIKPEVKVYNGSNLLREGKDYKVVYGKNNTNAYTFKESEEGFEYAKAPCFTVYGIGNYSDNQPTVYFTINPKNITDTDVILDTKNMTKIVKKGAQKLDPVLKWGKTTLSCKNGKDYVVKEESGEVVASVSKTSVGAYPITIEGRGNYTGVIETGCRIMPSDTVLASSLSVTLQAKKYAYTGKPVNAVVTAVKYKGQTLTQGADYKISYSSNVLPGTATVTITGNGKYVGTKEVNYTITGIPISKVAVEWGVNTKVNDLTLAYTGEALTHLEQSKTLDNPEGTPLKITYKASKNDPVRTLVLGKDYALKYSNNVKVGKGTLEIVGKGEFSGVKKVTFKISGASLADAGKSGSGYEVAVGGHKVVLGGDMVCVPYLQGATTPEVIVSANGLTLREGIDYTVSYSNNKKVMTNTGSKTTKGKYEGPFLTVKGKGLYTGTADIPFSITPQNMSELKNVYVMDVVYADKDGNYKSKVNVTDLNGKALKEGKDFSVKYYDGTVVDESKELGTSEGSKKVAAGGTVTAAIWAVAEGSYTGTVTTTYRVLSTSAELKNISKAKITIRPQIYNGKPIEITTQDVGEVSGQIDSAETYFQIDKNTKTPLVLGTDFEIVGYQKNINKGTATVYIKGKGAYTGIKKISFKINVKGISNGMG